MTKRRVVDGRMITTTDTRCTIRSVTDAEKYQWLLRLFVYLGDSPAETLDAAIEKTMAKMPLEDV